MPQQLSRGTSLWQQPSVLSTHKCPTCQMTQPAPAKGRCNIDWHQPAEADTNLDKEAEEVGVRCSLACAGEPGPQGGRLRERQQLPYPSRCHAAL